MIAAVATLDFVALDFLALDFRTSGEVVPWTQDSGLLSYPADLCEIDRSLSLRIPTCSADWAL